LTVAFACVKPRAGREVPVGSFQVSSTAGRAERKDWTLIAIALSRHGLAPIQLQKSLHLLLQTYPRDVGSGYYEFRSINSGHFSGDIYPDAQALAGEGLVAIEISGEEGWQHYSATTAGLARAKQLEKVLRPPVLQYLRRVVEWASMRSFDQLIRRPVDSGLGVPVLPSESRPTPSR
jgi:hypothetical protein